jgi:hypothetical protein
MGRPFTLGHPEMRIMFWKSKPKRLPEPRDHHYVLGHIVLRQVCAQDPLQFFSLMVSEERDRYLRWLWDQAESIAKRSAVNAKVSELKVTTCKIKEFPTVIITLPETMALAEAKMVAVVMVGEAGESKAGVNVRYFTLEDGEDTKGAPRTVICEWRDNDHLNFGNGPPATISEFAHAIERHLVR